MFLILSGPVATFLLFLFAVYSLLKQDKEVVKATVAVGLILLAVNYLGESMSVAPIIVGFLFAILALFKIVYDE